MSTRPVTHGTAILTVPVRGFALTRAEYRSDLVVDRHDHEFASWTYVCRGSFTESFDHRSETCRAGTVLAKPGHAAHSNRYGPGGAACLLIEIRDADQLFDPRGGLTSAPVATYASGPIPAAARRVLGELVAPDAATELAVSALLLGMAASIARTTLHERTARPAWLIRVRDRLAEEFASPPSLATLAAEASVHPVHLCQVFRRAFQSSPGEFVRQARHEWAASALVATELSLVTIALRAGYSDQSHFARDFRMRTGLPPSRFRLAARTIT